MILSLIKQTLLGKISSLTKVNEEKGFTQNERVSKSCGLKIEITKNLFPTLPVLHNINKINNKLMNKIHLQI